MTLKILDELLLVGLRVVDEAAERVEPLLPQPGVDHVDGGALLADEEHPFPAHDVVGHEVRDRRRLPGAGRALDDVARPGAREADRGRLGRIAGDDVVPLLERRRPRRLPVHGAGREREDRVEGLVARAVREELGVVADERHLPVPEVAQGDAAEVEVPVIRVVVGRLAEREELLLTRGDRQLRGVGRRRPAPRCGALLEDLAEVRGARPHARAEQREAERVEVRGVVAVVHVEEAADAPAREAGRLAVAVESAPGEVVDEVDPRAVHLAERDARLARADARGEVVEERVDGRLGEIDRGRQVNPVELREEVAHDRVHLRLGAQGLEPVRVAHPLLLHQPHREQDERRVVVLRRSLLQVRPAQEADREPELLEPELGRVTGGVWHARGRARSGGRSARRSRGAC